MAKPGADNVTVLTPSVRGREEVKAALLDAATTLLAERGPAAVSVRDVADRAGVNHGLIHRHFGSKQALFSSVIDRLTSNLSAIRHEAPENFEGLIGLFESTSESLFWRVIARAILDGEVPSNLQSDFPVVRGLVEQFTSARESGDLDPQFDPRLVSAAAAALALGWLLFEPFLLPAANLDDVEPEQLRGELHVLMLGILDRLAPTPTDQGNTE
jgi:AcrR family transcriptional regulator